MAGGGDVPDTQTVSNTTIQKADPWAGQQPYLKDLFGAAQKLYRQKGPYYYPGDTTALFTPEELKAQESMAAYATGGARDLANQGLNSQSFLLGDVLKADSNPYMADYAQGAIRPVWEALMREAIPGVNSGAVASGQYGGSRQGIAQGMAIGDATQKSLDTTSKMYSDMYGRNLDALQKAVMTNEAVVKGGTMPDQLLATVGADRRAMQQALIDDALARWEWEQALPAAKLSQYAGAIQGSYGGQGTSTSTGTAPGAAQPSTAQSLLGAGMAGLGTYSMLSGAAGSALFGSAATASMIAPWAAGAVALASLFR
jgi:hypothetical protein